MNITHWIFDSHDNNGATSPEAVILAKCAPHVTRNLNYTCLHHIEGYRPLSIELQTHQNTIIPCTFWTMHVQPMPSTGDLPASRALIFWEESKSRIFRILA